MSRKSHSERNSRLLLAKQLCQVAGDMAMKGFWPSVSDFRIKPDGSVVTAFDLKIESYIRGQVARTFPNDGFLGEEMGEKMGRNAYRWIVDPIDGTQAFLRGVPLWSTLIALEADGEIFAGVAGFPAASRTFYAQEGRGAFVLAAGRTRARRLKVSQTSSIKRGLICFTERAHYIPGKVAGQFDRLTSAFNVARGWGDAFGHMMVAAGQADAMIDRGVKLWDCAAIGVIVREAGGVFTDYQGRSKIQTGCVVSSNEKLHKEVIRLTANMVQ